MGWHQPCSDQFCVVPGFSKWGATNGVTGQFEFGLGQCYISVSLSLGVFNASRVRDLGLPTIDNVPGQVETG